MPIQTLARAKKGVKVNTLHSRRGQCTVGLFWNPSKQTENILVTEPVTSTVIQNLNSCTSFEFYFHRAEIPIFVGRQNVPL